MQVVQGTPFFMPLEIHRAERLYIPHPSMPHYKGEVRAQSGSTFANGVGPEEEDSDSDDEFPPKFRFQHDLESLWWIALWIVLYRVKHPAALAVAKRVFTYGELPSPRRSKLFAKPKFAKYLKSIIPKELSSFVESLSGVREILYFSYVDQRFSGDGVMSEAATYSDIYLHVWGGFNKLAQEAQTIEFVFKDTTPSAEEANDTILHKRPRLKPKRKDDDDEYTLSTDIEDSEESDGDESWDSWDSVDEPEAKKSKLGDEAIRMPMHRD